MSEGHRRQFGTEADRGLAAGTWVKRGSRHPGDNPRRYGTPVDHWRSGGNPLTAARWPFAGRWLRCANRRIREPSRRYQPSQQAGRRRGVPAQPDAPAALAVLALTDDLAPYPRAVPQLDLRLGALGDRAARYGIGGHRPLKHGLPGRVGQVHVARLGWSRIGRLVQSNVYLEIVSALCDAHRPGLLPC